MHMQRHYYQMFLLQVIDKAVMLGLSSRITQAVEQFGDRSHEPELADSLQDIERDFLQYVHRFRFTGVSGQLQAGEMYAQLRQVTGLDQLFQDLKAELDLAVSFLSLREAEKLVVLTTTGTLTAHDFASRMHAAVVTFMLAGQLLVFDFAFDCSHGWRSSGGFTAGSRR